MVKCCFWQRIRTKTRNISTTNALISINVLWLQRYKWCGQCYKRSTNKNYNWRLLLSWQICLSYKSRVVIYNCGALIAFDTDLWSIWCWGHPNFFCGQWGVNRGPSCAEVLPCNVLICEFLLTFKSVANLIKLLQS